VRFFADAQNDKIVIMFAHALKFKQKYYIQPEISAANNNNDIYSEVELLEAKKNLLRMKSFIEAKNALLRNEVAELGRQLEAFLHEYFEKKDFSKVLKISDVGVEPQYNEIKRSNFNMELKSIFKKLAKITHPDLGNSSSENYIKAQELYENGDIENLYFLYNQLNNNMVGLTLVDDIEHLEREIDFATKSNHELSEKLDGIYSSSEYALFLKFRSYEARGVDFYKEVLKFN